MQLAGVAFIVMLLAANAQPASDELELRLEEWSAMRVDAAQPLVLRIVLQPSGSVIREGNTPLGPKYVGPSTRRSLRTLLNAERFFSLPGNAEACPPDGGFKTIAATVGRHRHEVSFCGRDTSNAAVRSLLRIWQTGLTQLSDAKP